MRACILFGLLILGAASIVVTTPALTQGQPGRKGGGGLMSMDAGSVFEMYAKGRSFFLFTEARSLQGPLMQYAQEKGISNGQITRNQFLDFHAQFKAKMDAGAGASPFGGGAPPFGSGFPGGKKNGMGGPGIMTPAGPAPSADMINAQADALFERLDKNGDGKLNDQEMPRELRGNLTRFDKNNDGLIDKSEFRDYFLARMTGDTDPTAGRNSNQIVFDDDELDRKVVVLRAGKLPSNMPEWFKEYDLDADGQVALYEWAQRLARNPLKNFKIGDPQR